jgi:hypothetical protein
MLPKDLKAQWEKAKVNAPMSLDSHLEETPAKKHVIPYSDACFQQVTVEWLILTNQVCNKLSHLCFCLEYTFFKLIDALSHSKFHKMINVASRAPDRMNIPGYKQTRNEILGTFKTHLKKLHERLNVCQITSELNMADVFCWGGFRANRYLGSSV